MKQPTGVRMVALACRLYPARFRRLFVSDMVETFADDLARPASQHGNRSLFTIRTLALIIGDALGQHAAPLLPVSRAPRARNEMNTFWNDLRYAVRSLRRQPSFAIAAVATLAIAIGAGTAVYSVVDSVLLRPLPYDQPERLVVLWERNVARGRNENVVHPRNFEAWIETSSSLNSAAALMPASQTLMRDGRRFRVPGVRVSPEYFSMLGVRPALGRWLAPEDAVDGGSAVVVLGHTAWVAHFGADPEIVGKTISLQDAPHTVVGVMPEEFHAPKIGWVQEQEMWLPFEITEDVRGYGRSLVMLAQLNDNVSIDAARSEFNAIGLTLAAEEPRNEGWGINTVSLRQQVVGSMQTALWTVLAGVGLVLLIACANVASLILTRTERREEEFALRAALGAGTGRLTRQLMTEGLLLAVLGGIGGALLGTWLLDATRPLLPASLPRLAELELNAAVFVMVAAVTMLAVIATGLLPAARVRSRNLRDQMTSRTGRHESMGKRLLVVGEIALAVVLTVAAGLMVRSYRNMSATDLHFSSDDVIAMRVSLSAGFSGPEQRAAAFEQITAGLMALPSTEQAATINARPMGAVTVRTSVDDPASPTPEGIDPPSAAIRQISAGLIDTLSMDLLDGRDFDGSDRRAVGRRVLVNRALARQLWPDESAIGKRLTINLSDGIETEVVGVVDDVRFAGAESDAGFTVFRSAAQFPARTTDVLVRGDGAIPGMETLRPAVLAVDPGATIYDVASLDDLIGAASADRRFTTWLLAAFASIATLLAAVGVYGVLANDVAMRRREIAVRVALGAKSRDVLTHVVRRGMSRALIGIGIGVAASLVFMRFIAGLLFGVSPVDLPTLTIVSLVILGVALATNLLPAWRAMRVDPVATMRSE